MVKMCHACDHSRPIHTASIFLPVADGRPVARGPEACYLDQVDNLCLVYLAYFSFFFPHWGYPQTAIGFVNNIIKFQ